MLMPRLLPFLFLLAGLKTLAQAPSSVEELAKELCPANYTEKQKVEAIFRWITDNISYNLRLEKIKNPVDLDEEEDTSSTLKPLHHRVAETVLRRRQAVCDGYARLFKSLCDHAGIKSELITGYARTSMSRNGDRFKTNHSWNAVFFDSSWHLLDVTWASGYITFRADEFVRSYDPEYFLTSPARFIHDHYPEDLKWTLLGTAPVLKEFERSPFRYGAFITSMIKSFYPAKGIILASPGDTLLFGVESTLMNVERLNELSVTTIPLTDSSQSSAVETGNGKLSFSFVVPEIFPEWVYVNFNGSTVLRYKINRRNDSVAAKEERAPGD